MLQFVNVLLKQDTQNQRAEKLQMHSLTRKKQSGTITSPDLYTAPY